MLIFEKDARFAKFVYPINIPEKTSACKVFWHMLFAPLKWIGVLFVGLLQWSWVGLRFLTNLLLKSRLVLYVYTKDRYTRNISFEDDSWIDSIAAITKVPNQKKVLMTFWYKNFPIIPLLLFPSLIILTATSGELGRTIVTGFVGVFIGCLLVILFSFAYSFMHEKSRIITKAMWLDRIRQKVCPLVEFR